jgi:dihydroorotate dehydrogenase electron transfer subunit
MNKKVCDLIIIKHTPLNYNNFLLELKSLDLIENIKPGQFINVQVEDSSTTFLRRPFSVHEVDYKNNTISILVKEVGEGTSKITHSKVGDSLSVVFPLGNGFTKPLKTEKVLLIGGGVGIAPMMHFSRELKENGTEVHILLGAKTQRDHILIDEFKHHGNVYITTDDGSLGEKGFVVQHSILNGDIQFDCIYCCGPDVMMRSIAKMAKSLSVKCEVSLENMMACGFGVCLCCVTKTKEGNKCVCSDGPVFNINELEWQI